MREILHAFARFRPRRVYRVWCRRDEETNFWYVFKSDIPGLWADAETLDELHDKVVNMAKDLLEEYEHNGSHDHHRQVPLDLLARDPMNFARC